MTEQKGRGQNGTSLSDKLAGGWGRPGDTKARSSSGEKEARGQGLGGLIPHTLMVSSSGRGGGGLHPATLGWTEIEPWTGLRVGAECASKELAIA